MSEELKERIEELSEEELKGVSGGAAIRGMLEDGREFAMDTIELGISEKKTPGFDESKLTKNTYS